MFSCAECGSPVDVLDGIAHRDCPHDEAGIVADLTGTATGEGTADAPREPDGGVR